MSLDLVKLATEYVEQNIANFHQAKLDKLKTIRLSDAIKRKNPYLFRANNLLTAEEFVRAIVQATVIASEETILGNWLEGLAIYINSAVYGGRKSGIKGIDLEFEIDGVRQLVNIKSGPNWGNSSQITKMKTEFADAIKTLRTSGGVETVRAVNGCCYGKDNNFVKTGYEKLCGQRFWQYISGNADLYVDLIVPIGYESAKHNESFQQELPKTINRFTKQFLDEYCFEDGSVDWAKIIRFNSEASAPKPKKAKRRKKS